MNTQRRKRRIEQSMDYYFDSLIQKRTNSAMKMMQIQQLVIGIFLLHSEFDLSFDPVNLFRWIDLRKVDSIVCYQCTDCPEPFVETYPYVTLSNNTNFLAQCTVSF